MKLTLLSAFFMISYCAYAQTDVHEDFNCFNYPTRVFVKFNTPINGYSVYLEVLGNIQLEIERSYKSIVYIGFTDSIFDYVDMVTLDFEMQFGDMHDGDCISMAYDTPILSNPTCFELCEYRNVPFFFFDIDMDGKDEFIVRAKNDGSYFSDAYEVYELRHYKGELLLREDPPFDSLDSSSKIDFTNKEIVLTVKDGGMKVHKVKYKLTDSKWEMVSRL